MSLDAYLEYGPAADPVEAHWQNITHNLGGMAAEGGIYELLWRPTDGQLAGSMVDPLRAAIAQMKADPPRFEKHNAPNGWGLYENFVPWLEKLEEACRRWPDARYRASV